MIQKIQPVDQTAPKAGRIARFTDKLKNIGSGVKSCAIDTKDTVVRGAKRQRIVKSISNFAERHPNAAQSLETAAKVAGYSAVYSIPIVGTGLGAYLGAALLGGTIATLTGGGVGAVTGIFTMAAVIDYFRFR